jgi:Transcriptional regulator
MSKKRLEDITVNEICDAALVRRATFYNHFSDKYDLFNYLELQKRKELGACYELDNENLDLVEFCMHICRDTLAFKLEHSWAAQMLLDNNTVHIVLNVIIDQVYCVLIEKIEAEIKIGRFKPVASVDVTARVLAAGLIHALHYFIVANNKPNEKQIFADMEIICRAILNK